MRSRIPEYSIIIVKKTEKDKLLGEGVNSFNLITVFADIATPMKAVILPFRHTAKCLNII